VLPTRDRRPSPSPRLSTHLRFIDAAHIDVDPHRAAVVCLDDPEVGGALGPITK
jgi:hypothetical protein